MLGTEEFVLERGHLATGGVKGLPQRARKLELARTADNFGAAGKFGVELFAELEGGNAQLFQKRTGDAFCLVKKSAQDVFIRQLRVPALVGIVLGGLESLLGKGGKLIWLHGNLY